MSSWDLVLTNPSSVLVSRGLNSISFAVVKMRRIHCMGREHIK